MFDNSSFIAAVWFPCGNLIKTRRFCLFTFLGSKMQFMKIVRRVLIASSFLSWVACAGAVEIGDTSRPLMPPGSGLVAASVVFSNPTQDESWKFRSFQYYYWFEATDGQQPLWVLNSSRDAVSASKTPRAKNDDMLPQLILTAVKPGKYHLTRAHVTQNANFDITPKNTPEIEVVEGQVTYVGSILMTYESHFRGLGVLTPRYFKMGIVNDFDRDVNELKALDKRLETVVITNGLKSKAVN